MKTKTIVSIYNKFYCLKESIIFFIFVTVILGPLILYLNNIFFHSLWSVGFSVLMLMIVTCSILDHCKDDVQYFSLSISDNNLNVVKSHINNKVISYYYDLSFSHFPIFQIETLKFILEETIFVNNIGVKLSFHKFLKKALEDKNSETVFYLLDYLKDNKTIPFATNTTKNIIQYTLKKHFDDYLQLLCVYFKDKPQDAIDVLNIIEQHYQYTPHNIADYLFLSVKYHNGTLFKYFSQEKFCSEEIIAIIKKDSEQFLLAIIDEETSFNDDDERTKVEIFDILVTQYQLDFKQKNYSFLKALFKKTSEAIHYKKLYQRSDENVCNFHLIFSLLSKYHIDVDQHDIELIKNIQYLQKNNTELNSLFNVLFFSHNLENNLTRKKTSTKINKI